MTEITLKDLNSRISAAEIRDKLCTMHGLEHTIGGPNYSQFAKLIGVDKSTITQIVQDPDAQMSPFLADKISRELNISPNQAAGVEPIGEE